MSWFRNTIIAGVLVLGACQARIGGDGPTDPNVDYTRTELEQARLAIFEGLDLGRGNIATSVNQVLSENLLDATFAAGATLRAPAPPEANSCPFLDVTTGDVTLRCRFLVERARDLAYASMAPSLESGPASPELAEVTDRGFIEYWHQQGAFSGVDGEVVRAVAELRRQGACDTAPTPTENSELAGYEVGRALYIERLEAQVAVTPPTVCDFDTGIILPALELALDDVPIVLSERPLCPDYAPVDPAVMLELDRAKLSYELGIKAGIRDQAVISSQDLLTTWVCTPPVPEGGGDGGGGGAGDPLVVDIDGDGIAPLALSEGVQFDLGGTGVPANVAWPAADDALLAIDLDGSGAIESGRELFGNYTVGPGDSRFSTGFEALAAYDRRVLGGNGDGAIDAADSVFERLLIWRDADRDGVSDAGELTPVSDAGVALLSLDSERVDGARAGNARISERAGNLVELWIDLRY